MHQRIDVRLQVDRTLRASNSWEITAACALAKVVEVALGEEDVGDDMRGPLALLEGKANIDRITREQALAELIYLAILAGKLSSAITGKLMSAYASSKSDGLSLDDLKAFLATLAIL